MTGLQFLTILLGINKAELVRKMGVIKQNFQNWCTEKRKIPKKYLSVLSEELGFPEDFFMIQVPENKVEEIRKEIIELLNKYYEKKDYKIED